jgi:hypothetical protein
MLQLSNAGADLPERQRVIAIVFAIAILLVVVELVRKRKLREEYAILWIVTASGLLLLAFELRVLYWLTELAHAEAPVSVLFFCACLFLLAVALQFSVRLSKLTWRNKDLTQRLALLEDELKRLHAERAREPLTEQRLRDAHARDEDVVA